MNTNFSDNGQEPSSEPASNENRLYVPFPDSWTAHIKPDSSKEYCSFQKPGEDFFHLLVKGEIYLRFGDQRYCLNCAHRHEIVTGNRHYWQKGGQPESF